MRRLWLILSFLLTIPLTVSPQAPHESSFVVKLKYMKVNLPSSSSRTCLTVYPDGGFHLEQVSDWPKSRPQIFEDSLPNESLTALNTILEAQGLKELKMPGAGGGNGVAIARGELITVIIPRGKTIQKIAFNAGQDPEDRRPPKQFPSSLTPLVQWVQATTHIVEKQRLQPLKGKPVDCLPMA